MPAYVALTHTGMRRDANEDAVLARQLSGGWLLLAVADGVGGAPAGDIASRDAVRLLGDALASRSSAKQDAAASLADAFAEVNTAIWRRQQSEERLHGMCTTLVAALVREDRAWIANVGDSRAHLITQDGLTAISEDHSLVAEQIRDGIITEEESWLSDVRHIITRTIGSEEVLETDIYGPVDVTGARLLLTSDGVHDVIDPERLGRLAGDGGVDEAAQRIVDVANELGGPDNISVVLYESPTRKTPATDDGVIAEPLDRYAVSAITA